MNEKVLIVTDSTSDLGAELLEQYGVAVLPMTVTLGNTDYVDGVDIDPDQVYAHYERTGQLPKTAAINMAQFSDYFRDYTEQGYSVVLFVISSGMSSTYDHACMAAEDFDNVFVVDTKNLSTGSGLLVLSACDMAAEGKSAREIAEACAALASRVNASFVIDSLEFLHKGGRCSALEAYGAEFLHIKPCIAVKDGKMGVGKKYRGNFASVLERYIADRLGDGSSVDLDRVFVTHAGCDEELCRRCVEKVKQIVPFCEVLLTRAGCTVSSHCGRNTLGVLFMNKA